MPSEAQIDAAVVAYTNLRAGQDARVDQQWNFLPRSMQVRCRVAMRAALTAALAVSRCSEGDAGPSDAEVDAALRSWVDDYDPMISHFERMRFALTAAAAVRAEHAEGGAETLLDRCLSVLLAVIPYIENAGEAESGAVELVEQLQAVLYPNVERARAEGEK